MGFWATYFSLRNSPGFRARRRRARQQAIFIVPVGVPIGIAGSLAILHFDINPRLAGILASVIGILIAQAAANFVYRKNRNKPLS